MDNLLNGLKFELKTRYFTTARKRILKLVGLQSFVAKCCMRVLYVLVYTHGIVYYI